MKAGGQKSISSDFCRAVFQTKERERVWLYCQMIRELSSEGVLDFGPMSEVPAFSPTVWFNMKFNSPEMWEVSTFIDAYWADTSLKSWIKDLSHGRYVRVQICLWFFLFECFKTTLLSPQACVFPFWGCLPCTKWVQAGFLFSLWKQLLGH